MDYKENFKLWSDALKGTEYEKELNCLKDDEKLVEDSFYKYLEFGTAGMRGNTLFGNKSHEHIYGKALYTRPCRLCEKVWQ